MSITGDDYLDGDVPVRYETLRWDAYDADGNLIGEIAVDRDSPATIANDTDRSVHRTVTGLRILPRTLIDLDSPLLFADDIDPLSMRIRPYWLLGGDEYPLGLYLFGDDSRVIHTWGAPRECSLVDQCAVLDQPLAESVGYPTGTNITAALQAEATRAGIYDTAIDYTPAVLAQPLAWPAGRDTQMAVMQSLCTVGGFLPPYFNNDGALVCRSAPDIVAEGPTFRFGEGSTPIISESILVSSDLIDSPNRYVVVGGTTDTPIVGVYEVPPDAPHSFASTGRWKVRTVDVQGVETQASANAAASAAYMADALAWSWLSLDTPPDPRHDSYDICQYDGVNFLEVGWSLRCAPGGPHRHDLRGTYLGPDAASLPVSAEADAGEDTPLVVWYGEAGSFGATIPTLLPTVAIPGGDWPAGHSPWFSMLAGDGVLIIPSEALTTNAYLPTGKELVVARWAPPSGTMSFIEVLTDEGQAHPLHQGYSDLVGGATFEGITRIYDGEELFVLAVGKPWGGWQISVDGVYPTFVVLRRQSGVWAVDYTRSRTAEDMQDSNPTEAANIYVDTTDPIFSEAMVDQRQTLEMATFPASGHVAVMHYDSAPGAGYEGGAITVMDEVLDLQAGYLIPNVEWPTDHGLSVRPRGVAADPTSSINDEQFAVAYDVFDLDDDAIPAGVFLDGSSSVGTPDIAAWNVSGVMEGVVRVQLPDYTPSATMHLLAHDDIIGASRGWAFLLNSDGTLQFFLSSDGSSTTVNQASSAPSLTNHTAYWLGFRYDSGGGANNLQFYKAADAETQPSRWGGWSLISQHTVTGAVPFNSTSALVIGASGGFALFPLIGWVFRTALYDDGSEIANADFSPSGSPQAAVDSATYTDSSSRVWTMAGNAVICRASQSLIQVFSYDASGPSISAVSAPFLIDGVVSNRPTQVCYDSDGNLWVTTVFGGIYNDYVQVFESPLSLDAATASAWLNGDGSTTNEWAHVQASDSGQIAGTAIGAAAPGMAWDPVDEVMYVPTGSTGVIAIQRSGGSAPYSYTYVAFATIYSDDAPGDNGIGRPIIDHDTGVVWVPVRRVYSGSYPAASPPDYDQWLVAVKLGFWT